MLAKLQTLFTKHTFVIYLLLLCISFMVRISGMFRGLEYDEIWPLQDYPDSSFFGILFSDILSNYPPLTHAFNRLWFMQGVHQEFWYRFPNFLAGCVTPLVMYYAFWRRTKHNVYSICVALFCITSPILVHYSHMARPYSYVVLEVCLFLLLLTYQACNKRTVVLCLLTLLSQLTLLVAFLFIVPILGYIYVAEVKQKQGKWLDVILPCFIILVVVYFYRHILFLAQQQSVVTDFSLLITNGILILKSVIGLPIVVLVLMSAISVKTRFVAFYFVGVLWVAIVVALMSHFGPARVYIYIVPITVYLLYIFIFNLDGKIKYVFEALSLVILLYQFINVSVLEHKWALQADYKKIINIINQKNQKQLSYHLIPVHDGKCANFYGHNDLIINNTKALMVNFKKSLPITLVNAHGSVASISLFQFSTGNEIVFTVDKSVPVTSNFIDNYNFISLSLMRFRCAEEVSFPLLFFINDILISNSVEKVHHQIGSVWNMANVFIQSPIMMQDKFISANLYAVKISNAEALNKLLQFMPNNIQCYWVPIL